MPQLANFSLSAVKKVFADYGIHALEEYPDGQVLWGNEPISQPYKGLFHMADQFEDGRWDIFTIRGILNKLDKAGDAAVIEGKLFESIHEEQEQE